MSNLEHATPRRRDRSLRGWSPVPEGFDRDAYIVSDELLEDPTYHDGWSAIRLRPGAPPELVSLGRKPH